MSASIPSSNPDPDILASRLIQRAHNLDGLPEIYAGLTVIAFSGISWANGLLPPVSPARKILFFSFLFVCLAMCALANRIIKGVRRRYLIDRVGYVKPRPNKPKPFLVFAMALFVAVCAALAIRGLLGREQGRWLLVFLGAVYGGGQPLLGKLPRFYITGALSLAAGILLSLSDFSLEISTALFMDFVGVLAIISGVIVLLRFLRQPVEMEA